MKKTPFFFSLIMLFSCVQLMYSTVYTSNGDGAWDNPLTWTPNPTGVIGQNDDVIIQAGHTVTNNVSGINSVCRNLTVNGTLSCGSSMVLTIVGDYTVNGTELGTAGQINFNTGATSTISGSGIFSQKVIYVFYKNMNINSDATIEKTRTTTIRPNITVTNYGYVTLYTVSSFSGSVWDNNTNATLVLKQPNFFNTSGAVLIADANGNTVNYASGSNEDLKLPATSYYNLTLSGTASKGMPANLIVTNNFTLATGCVFNPYSYTLSVGGNFSSSGTFTTSTATLELNGSGTQSMTGTGNITFYNLTKSGSGTVSLSRNLTVSNLVSISAGILATNSYRIYGTGGLTQIGGELELGAVSYTLPELTGAYSLTGGKISFTGTGSQSIRGGISYLNVDISGSGTKTAAGNIDINGNLTINSTLDVSGSNYGISLAGNLINNGTFVPRNGTFTFDGNSAISGSAITSLKNITVSGTLTVPASTINVAGNWINNGTFNHNSGTIIFNGTTTVSGSATTSFNNITISNTLTASASTMNVAGSWVNNGTFNHNNGTVGFNGTTTVSGSATTSFNNVTISNTLTAPASTMNVAGNWVNNGTFNHNNGTIGFNGTTSISGSATNTLKNVTISGTLTAPTTNLNITGNWANNGTFNHNNGTIIFNGTTTVSGSATTSFNNVTISNTLTASASTMNVAGSWVNNGTFNHNNGTVGFNGTTLISGSATTSLKNVTISGTLTAPTTTLNIAGNFTNNGSFDGNNGLLILNGSTTQALSGSGTSVFESFTLANAAGANINSGTYNLHGVLTIDAGMLNRSGGTFTLSADATRYSRIAPINEECGSCGFSGNFTIERYLPSRDFCTWANLSSPVALSTMQDWHDELFMIYPFTGFDPNQNRPSGTNVLAYSEPSASYYELNDGTYLTAGKGFEIGLSDNATQTEFTNRILNTSGEPNYGSFDIPLSFTASKGPYAGENLIGNPYASAISLDKITITNALATVDVYDYTINNYRTLSGSDIIGPYQGFWAYAESSGASFNISENSKSTNTSTNVARTASTNNYLNLTIASADGSHEMAHTLKIACNENAKDGWDAADHPFRRSIDPKAPYITASSEKRLFSINTFNTNHETYTIPLEVYTGISGKYQINITGIDNIVTDFSSVLLEDKLTKTLIDLTSSTNYTFSTLSTDKKDRFVLHFSKSINYQPINSVAAYLPFNDQVEIIQTLQGNTVSFNLPETKATTVYVTDMLGRAIINTQTLQAKDQQVSINLPANFRGMYLIVVQTGADKKVQKFVTH